MAKSWRLTLLDAEFGFLANFAIVLNLLIMFISMGVMAHSEPNYDAAQAGGAGAALGGSSVAQLPDGSYPPVKTYGTVPPSSNGFIGGINGLMQGTYHSRSPSPLFSTSLTCLL